jgi:hypothetical protein
MFDIIKTLQDKGHKIILWTCREGVELQAAIMFCKDHNLIFDAINENVPEFKNIAGCIRKIYADRYVDDRAFGSIEVFKKDMARLLGRETYVKN